MMTPREAELTRQLEAAVSALEATRRENELLLRKIDLLVRRVFGSSSEQLPANQLELLFAQAAMLGALVGSLLYRLLQTMELK